MDLNIDKITLSKANDLDYDFFYSIKSEKNNIYWSGYRDKPEYEKLKLWFNNTVTADDKVILIIKQADIRLGYISYKVYDNICDDFSIAVSEKYNGYGVATKTMDIFYNYIKQNYIYCKQMDSYIREDNEISQSVHLKNGYYLTNEYQIKYFEVEEKEYKMQKWIKDIT